MTGTEAYMALLAIAESSPVVKPPEDGKPYKEPKDDRPTILVDFDEAKVNDRAVGILAKQDGIYQRGGVLVRVMRDRKPSKGIEHPDGTPVIATIAQPYLRELLTRVARWTKLNAESEVVSCHPPDWSIKAVYARGQWNGMPYLTGVAEYPILRPDGSVLQQAGYDRQTGLLYEPEAKFRRVPKQPTAAHVKKAVEGLQEVVCDFPFQRPVHEAAWFAGLLGPLARYAYHGPAPALAIDANVRGCGKGLLVHSIATILLGRPMVVSTAPKSDEEFSKAVTALAIEGASCVLIDNITGTFGGATIDAALTATTWKGRILGESRTTRELPLSINWYLTANNMVFRGDIIRRLLHVRLDSREERPEERSGFRHDKLIAWCRQERPRLIAAALVILRGFCAAGRPSQGLKSWGSFDDWSDLVRGAVVWAGLPDPAETRVQLTEQADSDVTILRMLLDGWSEADPYGQGMTVKGAIEKAADHPGDFPTLTAVIDELAPVGKAPNVRAIGMRLHHLRRRVLGGQYLDSKRTKRGAMWYAKQVESGDTSDTSDTKSPYPACESEKCTVQKSAFPESPRAPAVDSVTSVTSVTQADADCQHTDTFTDTNGGQRCKKCGRKAEQHTPQ